MEIRATEKQIEFLGKKGIDASGYSKLEASRKISELIGDKPQFQQRPISTGNQGVRRFDEKSILMARMNAINNAVSLLGIIGLPEGTNTSEALEITKEIANKLIDFICK